MTTSGKGTNPSLGSRRRKLIPLALALLVAAIAVTAWLLWGRTSTGPPLILGMPNGEKYQFAGETYGTKNVPTSLEAKVYHSLPQRLASEADRYVETEISQVDMGEKFETPQLFVWFRRLGTNAPPGSTTPTLIARLTDQAGVEAGVRAYANFSGNVAWAYAAFPVFPRRSRLLEFYLYPDVGPGNPAAPVAHFTFPNPCYGQFPAWKPEPLPAVKEAGDLEVRLGDFTTGAWVNGGVFVKANESGGHHVTPAVRGQDTVTAFDVSLMSPSGTSAIWEFFSAELSDATGNVLRNESFTVRFNGGFPPKQFVSLPYMDTIQGTLWPDEAAWRLKLEFKREFGLAPEEILTFTNVPVPAMGTTNLMGLTKTACGIQIELTKFVRQPNVPVNSFGRSEVTFELPGRPEGVADKGGLGSGARGLELPGKPDPVAIDFMGMETDAGRAEGYESEFRDSAYVIYVQNIPTNARTMNLTLVVQKTRTVEFLVQPPKPN